MSDERTMREAFLNALLALGPEGLMELTMAPYEALKHGER